MVLNRLYYATEFSLRLVGICLGKKENSSKKNKIFRLFSTLLHLLCIVPGLIYLVKEKQNFASITEDLTNIGLHIASLVNFYYYYFNSKKVQELYSKMQSVTRLESDCQVIRKGLNVTKDVNFIIFFIWAFLIGASVACSNQAVFLMYKYFANGERMFIFNTWLPFDSSKSPWFELTFLVQTIAMQNVGLAHYFADVYYMTVVGLYVIAMKLNRYEIEDVFFLTLLQEGVPRKLVVEAANTFNGLDLDFSDNDEETTDLENEAGTSAEIMTKKDDLVYGVMYSKKFRVSLENNLIKLIQKHQMFLEIGNEINDFFWPIMLYALTMNLFYVVTIPLLILIYWPNNLTKILIMVERTTTSMWQLLIITTIAQKVYDESLKYRNAIYSCPWYVGDLKIRKIFLIILTRCARPIHITAGKYLNLTLETFVSIVNLAFSFCTVLNNFIKRDP